MMGGGSAPKPPWRALLEKLEALGFTVPASGFKPQIQHFGAKTPSEFLGLWYECYNNPRADSCFLTTPYLQEKGFFDIIGATRRRIVSFSEIKSVLDIRTLDDKWAKIIENVSGKYKRTGEHYDFLI